MLKWSISKIRAVVPRASAPRKSEPSSRGTKASGARNEDAAPKIAMIIKIKTQ